MDNNQIVKHYHGNPITFLNKSNLMINATEMAKPFGKRPVDWLKTQSANDFINVYSKVKNITLTDLVRVTKGGDASGTWLHQDIALEFARWLSPQFAIWCNDRIKELLLKGSTSLNIPSYQISDPIKRAEQWIEEEKRRQKLVAENEAKQKLIEEQAPKVKMADTIVATAESIPVNMLAKFMAQKGYNVGEHRLFKYLRENGYIGRRGNHANVPCQRYIDMGLFEIQESTDGQHTSIVPMVTGKGQLYFINKFTEGKIPIERAKIWVPKNKKFGAYNYDD